MRTTLNLDDEALAAALAVAGESSTKTQVINEALREYARRHRLRCLLDYRGRVEWEGNLDDLRGRAPAAG